MSKHTALDPELVAKALMQFLSNFKRTFDQLSGLERKDLLRRMIETILMDKAVRIVRCYIKRLPSIPNITDQLQEPWVSHVALSIPENDELRFHAKNATESHGAACSPNGIPLQPENSRLVLTLDLD